MAANGRTARDVVSWYSQDARQAGVTSLSLNSRAYLASRMT
jgi:hypothetical protein